VFLEDWPTCVATEEMIRAWERDHSTWRNTSLLTRNAPTIDIDIKHEAAAEALEALVRKHFNSGQLMRRIGLPPKRAFLFKTEASFKKLQTNFIAPDGSEHKLEILGDGQQVVVDGIHPDTKLPYAWTGGTPWEVTRDKLPALDQASARTWLDEATAWLLGQGWQIKDGKPPTTDDDDITDSDLPLIVQLAARLWGKPERNNVKGEYRFGTHGWRRWFDFEAHDGGGIDDLIRMVRAADGKSEEIKPLRLIEFSNWDNEPVEQEYTVPDRIPAANVTLFSGEGAAGKSTIYLQLAAAHALGRDWLGAKPQPGSALFIDAEDGERVIHKRLGDILHFHGARFADVVGKLHLLSLAGEDATLGAFGRRSSKIEPTALYRQLSEMAGDLKPTTIGLASSANMFAGNEIDRSQVNQFIGLLTRIAIVTRGSLVLISHPSLTGIETKTGLSGSTQWHNAVRARFGLHPLGWTGVMPFNWPSAGRVPLQT
jgi:hypothetical protein